LGTFDSSPPSNVSSLRFQITPHNVHEPREPLDRFFSSPFPKLSKLDLENFLPNPSSPVFTTSNLTSLKLSHPFQKENCYTLSQFSQILQRHPSIQELSLSCGALPLPGQSGPLVSPVLPRLLSLRLHGSEAAISGFIDLIDMFSPLSNVVISFDRGPKSTALTLAGAVRKIIVAYYESQGSNYPRKIHYFSIVSNQEKDLLTFHTRSRPTPTSNLRSNFRLQFNAVNDIAGNAMVKEFFPLFPLDDVREFSAEGQPTYEERYNEMFQKMKGLSHLRLDGQKVLSGLRALYSGN